MNRFLKVSNQYGYFEYINLDKVTKMVRSQHADTYTIYFDNNTTYEMSYREFMKAEKKFIEEK